jgi:hypothetical protein
MVITLTPELEAALTERAHQQGSTPEQLALESLRAQFLPAAEEGVIEPQETMADFLGNSIGVLNSGEHVPGGAQMPEDTGRKFADLLVEQRRQGRL